MPFTKEDWKFCNQKKKIKEKTEEKNGKKERKGKRNTKTGTKKNKKTKFGTLISVWKVFKDDIKILNLISKVDDTKNWRYNNNEFFLFVFLFLFFVLFFFSFIYSFVVLALKTSFSVLESYLGLDNHRSLAHENYIHVLGQRQKKVTLLTLNVLYKRWLRCGLQMPVLLLNLHHPYIFT